MYAVEWCGVELRTSAYMRTAPRLCTKRWRAPSPAPTTTTICSNPFQSTRPCYSFAALWGRPLATPIQTNKRTHKKHQKEQTQFVLRSRRGWHGIIASVRRSSKQHNDPAARMQAGARPLPVQPRPRRRAHTVGSGGGWSSFVSTIQRGAGAAIGCALWPCGIVPEGEVAAAAHAHAWACACPCVREMRVSAWIDMHGRMHHSRYTHLWNTNPCGCGCLERVL